MQSFASGFFTEHNASGMMLDVDLNPIQYLTSNVDSVRYTSLELWRKTRSRVKILESHHLDGI